MIPSSLQGSGLATKVIKKSDLFCVCVGYQTLIVVNEHFISVYIVIQQSVNR